MFPCPSSPKELIKIVAKTDLCTPNALFGQNNFSKVIVVRKIVVMTAWLNNIASFFKLELNQASVELLPKSCVTSDSSPAIPSKLQLYHKNQTQQKLEVRFPPCFWVHLNRRICKPHFLGFFLREWEISFFFLNVSVWNRISILIFVMSELGW